MDDFSMSGRRIVYVVRPELFPSGGAKAIYRQVEILHEHGFPAFVAIHRRPKIDFYGSKAPLLIFGNIFLRSRASIRRAVRPGDIWVIPEVYGSYMRALTDTPAKRIMLCQGHYALPFTSNPRLGIAEFGAHSLLVTTESQMQFFRDVYRTNEIPYIQGYEVDRKIFSPAAQKKRQIAFMPRKLPADAAFIEAAFKRRHSRYADVPWVSIDHLAQHDVARILRESAVFLSLSHKDALGLPPLEAMACGCFCAGYHGDGGRTYMTSENGWWANDGDWLACVDGLASALALFDGDAGNSAAHCRAIESTVERYSPQQLKTTLLEFWRRELASPYP
jgi:Glycosyl transferases group 1